MGGVGAALLLLLVAVAAGQAGRSATARADDDGSAQGVVREIRRLEEIRRGLEVSGDTAALRGLLTTDFRGINPIGVAGTREELLSGFDAGEPDILAMQPTTPIEVDVFGNQALVRYQVSIELTIFGFHPNHLMWDTLLYERRHGRWRVAWEQTTAVPHNPALVLQALETP